MDYEIRELTDHLQRRSLSAAERHDIATKLALCVGSIMSCINLLHDHDVAYADQTRMAEHIRRICGIR